jgi:hypothetical protein
LIVITFISKEAEALKWKSVWSILSRRGIERFIRVYECLYELEFKGL